MADLQDGESGLMLTGYLHGAYAAALGQIGSPLQLCDSGGWILKRPIAGTDHCDATGCYPLFACSNWSGLEADLEGLRGLVSVGLVTDPFGAYQPAFLKRCFPDVMIPFKEHFVADLSRNREEIVGAHHRRQIRIALRSVEAEFCSDPASLGEEWVALYGNLIGRRSIAGVAAFPPASLIRQLEAPGLQVVRAILHGKTIGMLLWMIHNRIAYGHLMGYSELGYKHRASYALLWESYGRLQEQGVRWVNLGGVPGVSPGAADPELSAFKRGWSTETRTAYFCGRVLDREAYEALTVRFHAAPNGFFPAYRRPSACQA